MKKLIVLFLLTLSFAIHSMDIFRACEIGDIARVNELITQGVDLSSAVLPNGVSALHAAAFHGHSAIVQILLDRHVAVDLLAKNGRTALHYAAQNGCSEVVKLLLARGASVNAADCAHYTALHMAILNERNDIVKLLSGQQHVINAVNTNGLTSLHTAAFSGHSAVVQFLLDHGVSPDVRANDGCTPLQHAAESGYSEVVRLLLARGASVNAVDRNGYTALHVAVLNERNDIVRLLLEQNPVINAVLPNGFTSLHAAACKGHSAVVQFLLDHNVSPDVRTKNGCIALHYAAKRGCSEVVKLLLARGASVNIVDLNGHTALDIAQSEHHSDVAQLLLQKGADPQVRVDCALYSKLIESVGQIKTKEARSKFLCSILGINRGERNFKLSYISKLCEIANFLYLQNLWAKSITNIFFLYQELKKIEWSHGIIYNFALFETNEEDHPLDDKPRFAGQQTMFMVTRNVIISGLNLIQWVMQEPFKFSQCNMKMIDEYLQSQDKEIKIIAHATKLKYIYKELLEQLFNALQSLRGPLSDGKLALDDKSAYIPPIITQMIESLELMQDITAQAESRPDILIDINLSEQFLQKFNSIMRFIEDSHTALECLYELIYNEKRSLTPSAQSIRCSVAKNVSMLPDKIYWPNRILSFDQYFSCNESQESPMLTTQIEPAAAASSAVGAASDGGWIPEVLKRNAAKQGNKHQVKPAMKTRGKVAEHQYNPDDQRVTGKPAEPAASPAPSPAVYPGKHGTPVKPRKANQQSVRILCYDKRVKRWFKPEFVRSQNQDSVLYHAFSPRADTYILQGVRSPWKNKVNPRQVDTLYSLPGEVLFPDGTRRFAIFSCCLDPQGVCYHRGITYKSLINLESMLQGDIYRNIEYRENTEVSDHDDTASDGPIYEQDPFKGVETNKFFVKIHDAYNNVDIILYKLKKDPEQVH